MRTYATCPDHGTPAGFSVLLTACIVTLETSGYVYAEPTIPSNRSETVSAVSGSNSSNGNGDAGNGSVGGKGSNAGNAINATKSADSMIAGTAAPVMVNVSYTLWVGSNVNETYNLTVIAPKNETFYEVMLLAAEMSPHFQFVASEWPNGHYVHTIVGYKEEPMSYHYWLLYRLPSPPDPSSPPGNQLVAPGGTCDRRLARSS